MNAQIAAGKTGEKDFRILDRFGIDLVKSARDEILDNLKN